MKGCVIGQKVPSIYRPDGPNAKLARRLGQLLVVRHSLLMARSTKRSVTVLATSLLIVTGRGASSAERESSATASTASETNAPADTMSDPEVEADKVKKVDAAVQAETDAAAKAAADAKAAEVEFQGNEMGQ